MRSTIAALVVSFVLFAPVAEAKTKIRHLATGITSGFHEAGVVVAGDPVAFQGMWDKHTAGVTPKPELPTVDFKKEMVVLVMDGDKPTGGYKVWVTEAVATPKEYTIKATSTGPAPGSVAAEMVTQPFDMVAIPKNDVPVKRVDAKHTCGK